MGAFNTTVTNKLENLTEGLEEELSTMTLIPEVSQSELIEAISDRVVEKLVPVIARLEDKQDSGVLVGAYQISRYVGIGMPTVVRWYETQGFPMDKTGRGRWRVTKAAVDRFFFGRGVMMRKLVELGCEPIPGHTGKFKKNPPPERFTTEQRAHAMKEIIKGKARGAVNG